MARIRYQGKQKERSEFLGGKNMKNEVQAAINFDGYTDVFQDEMMFGFKEIEVKSKKLGSSIGRSSVPTVNISTNRKRPYVWFNKAASELIVQKQVKVLFDQKQERLLLIPCGEAYPNKLNFEWKENRGIVWAREAIVSRFLHCEMIRTSKKKGTFRFVCNYQPEMDGILIDLKKGYLDSSIKAN